MRHRDDPEKAAPTEEVGQPAASEFAACRVELDPTIATKQELKTLVAVIASYFVDRAWGRAKPTIYRSQVQAQGEMPHATGKDLDDA